MISLVLRALAVLLAIVCVAIFCHLPALWLLHRAVLLPASLPLASLEPLAFMSLAAFPVGALCALGLARAPRGIRSGVCGLLVLALAGAISSKVQVQPAYAAWAPVLASIALVMLILTPRLAGLDPILLEAVAASGASPLGRFRLVILPWTFWSGLAAILMCLAADAAFWLSAG